MFSWLWNKCDMRVAFKNDHNYVLTPLLWHVLGRKNNLVFFGSLISGTEGNYCSVNKSNFTLWTFLHVIRRVIVKFYKKKSKLEARAVFFLWTLYKHQVFTLIDELLFFKWIIDLGSKCLFQSCALPTKFLSHFVMYFSFWGVFVTSFPTPCHLLNPLFWKGFVPFLWIRLPFPSFKIF